MRIYNKLIPLIVLGTLLAAPLATTSPATALAQQHRALGVEVSSQLTGGRQEARANKHRIPVEERKTEQERGYYLLADAFNQAEDNSILMLRPAERQIPKSRQAVALSRLTDTRR